MSFLFFICTYLCVEVSFAEESNFFTQIDDPIQTGVGATWSFPLFVHEQWFLASGQGGDLTIAPLDDFGVVNMEEVQTITDMGTIKDHALRMCPDGTLLYAASIGIEEDIFVYTLDTDFSIISQSLLEQGTPLHAANDMSAICSERFKGVGVAELQGLRDFFYVVEGAGELSIPIELAQSPRMTGAGLWEQEETLYVVGRDALPELSIAVYDRNYTLLEQHLLPPISAEIINYWSTSMVRIGEYVVLVSMGRDSQEPWPMDTGDVYLAILTTELDLVEWIQLTEFVPSDGGGMRPWLAFDGHKLWVSYDRANKVELISLYIDETAFGGVAEPSSEPSSDSTDTAIDPVPADSNTKNNGCAGFFIAPFLCLYRKRIHQKYTTIPRGGSRARNKK